MNFYTHNSIEIHVVPLVQRICVIDFLNTLKPTRVM